MISFAFRTEHSASSFFIRNWVSGYRTGNLFVVCIDLHKSCFLWVGLGVGVGGGSFHENIILVKEFKNWPLLPVA